MLFIEFIRAADCNKNNINVYSRILDIVSPITFSSFRWRKKYIYNERVTSVEYRYYRSRRQDCTRERNDATR